MNNQITVNIHLAFLVAFGYLLPTHNINSKPSYLIMCLSHCSIAVKRHHDQGNSYKRKHLIGACIQFRRFSLLPAWWHADSSGIVSGSCILICRQRGTGPAMGFLKPLSPLPVTHFLQQVHIYSSRPHLILLILLKQFHSLVTKHANI